MKREELRFTGFPEETVLFLKELSQNNNKAWFDENRHRYENFYLKPAFSFINDMGAMLSKGIAELQYEAKVNKSIYRINRDTRFSSNKRPYKTHLGIIFWKGAYIDRNDNSCFYFHVEPDKIIMATGIWRMTSEVAEQYRKSLLNPATSKEFLKIADDLKKQLIPIESDEKFKRYPKGFDKDNPAAQYSLYKSVTSVTEEIGLPDIIHRRDFLDYCYDFYSKNFNLMNWLSELTYKAVKH